MTQQDDGQIMVPEVMPENYARVNVTYGGTNGDLLDPIPYDTSDADVMSERLITLGAKPTSVGPVSYSSGISPSDRRTISEALNGTICGHNLRTWH